jgi:hypothetical protein
LIIIKRKIEREKRSHPIPFRTGKPEILKRSIPGPEV